MIVLSAIVFIMGALASAAADSLAVLTVARVFVGVAIGIASAAAPVYISEVAPPESRGRMVSFFQLSVTVGILSRIWSVSRSRPEAIGDGCSAWAACLPSRS
jgi:MFS transporter, SP family, galactose:H+ symporter